MVDYFQENNPSIKVYDELGKASESNPFIKIYLNKIFEHKFNNFQEERPKYNYELVREKINNSEIVPLPPARAKDLSNNDIKKLADDFLKENNRKKQEKYMRIFDRVKFPYDYRPILNLAKSKYSDNDQLIEYSVNALRYFSGKDIREFAMEILQKTSHPEIYVNLLISNYENGDSALLKGFVDSTNNKDKVHSLVWGYVDIYRANKTKDCEKPLIALYDKLTCSIHRKEIVEILYENSVLPEKIMNEIEFDSYDETRKLHNAIVSSDNRK